MEVVLDWMWQRRDELPGMLVVVPTAQSGRRLREGLAERGGCLAPRVVTPGFFLRGEGAVPEAVELLGWVETLESIADWGRYEAAFPVPPGQGEASGWSLGLARSLAGVRRVLQENALTIGGAAKGLAKTVESARWQALAGLEREVEKRLSRWGGRSRSMIVAQGGVEWPVGLEQVVLAGVPDLGGAMVRELGRAPVAVRVLVGAPEAEAGSFDEWGRPLEAWAERTQRWPENGGVTLVADPREQAAEVVRLVAEAGTESADLALGSADPETAGELVRAFGRAAWVAHDPSRHAAQPLAGWLRAWRAFLSAPGTAAAIDLLEHHFSGPLAGGKRAQRVVALSAARDRWLARDVEDLARAGEQTRRELERESLGLAGETLESLVSRAAGFRREGFHAGMRRILPALARAGAEIAEVDEWIEATAELAREVEREPGFWLDLLVATLSDSSEPAPDGRMLDVQGWLELLHEPGRHLVVCGMNEGMVPGRASTDAWLPESTRRALGLASDGTRAARDGYLLRALIECRSEEGRVDLLLGKASAGGDALLPSRLLLAADEEDLPERVKQLFREVEPPDSSLPWTLDEGWKWRPRELEPGDRLGVTAFSTYLACPFRYYLKYVVGMSEPEPERVEWNARDFGNVAHAVVERWARDDKAREFSKTEAIETWVHEALDGVIAERFGSSIPLALRIQREAMRQRLSWFARVQAVERASGWRIREVETKFELKLGGFIVAGRVDRIDVHDDGRTRVIDYKTGVDKAGVEGAHRTGITASTRLPDHVEGVEEIVCEVKGKPKRWKNLQLALYAAALKEIDEVGYFTLGSTEADVRVTMWDGFGESDRESALACAGWVAGQVEKRAFWPPAERVTYDDLKVMALGRSLVETVAREGGAA